MDNYSIKLACPFCKKSLSSHSENFLNCPKCSGSWPVRDGIPSFSKKEIYWNEIPKPKMNELLNIAQTKNWKTAIYDVLQLNDKRDFNIIGDERRADWRYLLPLQADSTVLDLGCGWGAIAIALTKTYQKVVAMDPTWERLKFLSIRKKQQQIDNLYLVHGGTNLGFPFPNNYFNLISMIGVLEWLAWGQDKNPRQVQKNALKKIWHLLKKDGFLYIGIENRFGYNYLLGTKDHNGLRFISLMPRFLANFISKKFKEEPYTNYQYSLLGYTKLLKQAGFSKIEFFAPLPQYRLPFFYLPLDNKNSLRYFFNNLFYLFETATPEMKKNYGLQYKIAKAGMKLIPSSLLSFLIKFINPGFCIIAKK